MAETVVDYERVVVAFKAYITSRPSHGQRDLLSAIARMEVESVRQEEEERVARLARSADNGHNQETAPASIDRPRAGGVHAEQVSTH